MEEKIIIVVMADWTVGTKRRLIGLIGLKRLR